MALSSSLFSFAPLPLVRLSCVTQLLRTLPPSISTNSSTYLFISTGLRYLCFRLALSYPSLSNLASFLASVSFCCLGCFAISHFLPQPPSLHPSQPPPYRFSSRLLSFTQGSFSVVLSRSPHTTFTIHPIILPYSSLRLPSHAHLQSLPAGSQ